jgi:hypothetical protein
VLEESTHDLTVLKLHLDRLTLKLYDKRRAGGADRSHRPPRQSPARRQRLEKLSIVLARLQRMVIDFLNVVHAVHLSTLDAGTLDALPQPTHCGAQRLAGDDVQKPRMRTVMEAVLGLALKPGGFTARDLADKLRALLSFGDTYTPRQAAYACANSGARS